MKTITTLVLTILGFALSGCRHNEIHESTSPLVMRLDNFGGDNHGGRRIELHADGTFRNEWYSDVFEGDRDYNEVYVGTYLLNDDRTQLTLHPDADQPQETLFLEDDAVETLYRVDVEGVEYWVAEEDRERIKDPNEITLQDESLQRDKE